MILYTPTRTHTCIFTITYSSYVRKRKKYDKYNLGMPSEPISGAQNTDIFRFEGTVNYQLIAEANLTKPRQLSYTHTHKNKRYIYTHDQF